MTEKLYWSLPRALAFEASALAVRDYEGKASIVLERTLFYPEGGGQLGDTGTLTVGAQALTIADTQIDEAGAIHHVLTGATSEILRELAAQTGVVRGAVDAPRRLDHTAQHTAQHALSRALADAARAETVSARLGASSCTIDVARPGIPDIELHRAEDLVNALIAANVEVRALYPETPEAVALLPLRKQPKVTEGTIRVIDIEDFDMTPCGGTHCTRTGQMGQVRIVGQEKYKGMLRLTFHAGLRALTDARAKHEALTTIATDLTCGLFDVAGAVTKLRTDLKATRSQLDAARAELADRVAAAMLAALPSSEDAPGPVVLPLLRAGDDAGALRLLAAKLVVEPRVVALVATLDPTSGELVLVVQRGTAGRLDCGAFVQAETKARAGRGGGRPERAEGRFPRGTSLDDIASSARAATAS